LSLILVEEWKRDVFKGIEHQNVLGVGVLWSALDIDRWALTIHAAPGWTREETTDGVDETFTVGVLELQNSFTLTSNTTAAAVFSYYENFDDSIDHRFDSTLEVTTDISDTFSLSLEYEWEFDNAPAAGSLTTDRTFTSSLTYTITGASDSSGSEDGS
jgi:putative salt-induced outer membrane protein YdiY